MTTEQKTQNENEVTKNKSCCNGKRRPKTKMHTATIIIAFAVLVIAGLAMAAPTAAKHFMSPDRIKAHIDDKVIEMMDEINATEDQRTDIQALKEDLMNTFISAHENHSKKHEELLKLWKSDYIDPQLIDSKINEHLEAKKVLSSKVANSVMELHRILTPAQRNQLADIVEERVGEMHKRFHSEQE